MNTSVEADTEYRVSGGTDRPTVVEPVKQPPARKDRATRRAMGQRNPRPTPQATPKRWTGAHVETGPQRAQRRAAARGLAVGRSVAAQCRGWLGFGDPPSSRHYVPREERTYAGPGGATPLDFGQRIENYQIQASARDHALVGPRWSPTPRQYRRLDRKTRHAAAPFGPKSPDYMPATRGRRADMVIVDDPYHVATVRQDDPAFVPKVVAALLDPANAVKPDRGFRVVDRRGEHR